MPEPRRIQSTQGLGPDFQEFLANFQALQSYTMAKALMEFMTTMLMQLSQVQLAVKLTESLVSGSHYDAFAQAVASNLSNRLDDIYQGNARQLAMTMLHGQPFSNSPVVLQKSSQALDKTLTSLNMKNLQAAVEMKKSLGPDAPDSDNKNDYSGPRQGKR